MSWWNRLLSGQRLEKELDAELRYHLERQVEDNVGAGMTEDEARRLARDQFGGLEQVKEECRDVRGTRWLEETLRDLRLAYRTLAKDKPFATAATLTLALGIGLNGAVFSVVEAVLIRPLPARNPEALVWISERGDELETISGALLHSWAEGARSFEVLSPLLAGDADLEETASKVRFACVSADLGRLLGVTPPLGRDFLPQDFHDAPGAPGLRATETGPADGVAIVSHRLFVRLGGSEDLLGRSLAVRGVSYTVVGVLPSSLRLPVPPSLQLGVGPPAEVDLYLSTAVDRQYRGPGAALGRLAPGYSTAVAAGEIETLARHAEPPTPSGPARQLRVVPLHERVVGGVRRTILLLWACGGLVLLIACANVSGMLMARLLARRREMSVRLALGAGRWRLVRQLLAENAVLALAASVAGLIVAYVCLVGLRQAGPVDVPRLRDATFTTGALLACVAASLVTALALSAVPVLHGSFASVASSGKAMRVGFRSAQRWQGALVIAELALTLTLLTGAGLMLRSLRQVQAEGAALVPEHVLAARVRGVDPREQVPPGDRFRRSGRLIEELEAVPGVHRAALWTVTFGLPARVEGLPAPPEPPVAMWFNVSPGFYEASGVRLVAGRWFTEADRHARPPVVVVSERLARTGVHGGADAAMLVGRRTPGPFPPAGTGEGEGFLRIIGVVSDYRSGQLGILQPDDQAASPQVFYLDALRPILGGELLVRTATPPESLLRAVRRTVAGSGGLRLIGGYPLHDSLSRAIAPRRFHTILIVWFGGTALLLAAVGVAGVLTFSVAQRRAEIAVRMVLGARQANIRMMIISDAAVLLGAGLVAGLAGAAFLARSSGSVLYGVQVSDPTAYILACSILVFVPLCAAYLPARQAMDTNPWETLRRE